MMQPQIAQRVLDKVLLSPLEGAALRRFAMQRLADIPGYDWCGIYRLEGSELLLDEFVGAPTNHRRIRIGMGVCGTAIAENRNMVVGNVNRLQNYLACSASTKAEIVVLIKDPNRKTLGQIDVDGHRENTFDHSDEEFLIRLAAILAKKWGGTIPEPPPPAAPAPRTVKTAPRATAKPTDAKPAAAKKTAVKAAAPKAAKPAAKAAKPAAPKKARTPKA